MTETRYNGWTNKETWAVNLHLSNDEFLYKKLNRYIKADITEDSTDSEIIELFTDFVNNHFGTMARNEVGDFSRVNWLEIGRDWIDEVVL